MRHRRATPGRPRFPARKIPRYSNGKPACAIRCTGRTPRDRDRAALRGRPRILAKPRMPARRRWFKRWRLSDTREGLSPPVHINGENSRERCAASESWIQMTPAGGIEWVSARNGAGVVTVMRIITGLSPWSRTTVRSGWRSRAGFVNRRRYSAARIARSEDAGDGESSRRCLTAAGASRRRFPLTGRSRRDSIRGTGRHWPDERPAQMVAHLHGPNPQHGVTHVSG